MRLVLAIFIYFVTVYQPAIAVTDVTADEEVRLVPHDNGDEQAATATAESKAETVLEESRGRMLYENHCTSCHESRVHIRAKRKAKNYNEVGYWVNHFAGWVNLGWTDLEIQDVMEYVNERYYKYPMTEY